MHLNHTKNLKGCPEWLKSRAAQSLYSNIEMSCFSRLIAAGYSFIYLFYYIVNSCSFTKIQKYQTLTFQGEIHRGFYFWAWWSCFLQRENTKQFTVNAARLWRTHALSPNTGFAWSVALCFVTLEIVKPFSYQRLLCWLFFVASPPHTKTYS